MPPSVRTSYVCLSVCLGQACVHYDHTVHFSADLSLHWIVQCAGHSDTQACPPNSYRLLSIQRGREEGYICASQAKHCLYASTDK